MEKLYKEGKVKAIGVSNFSQMKLEELLPHVEIVPAANQLELHLYNPQHKLIEYLNFKGIVPQAYSPLGLVLLFVSVPIAETLCVIALLVLLF